MNTLSLSIRRDDDSIELIASLAYNGFVGTGSCYLENGTFTKCAQRFALYPLPDEGVCLEGGYFNEDMRGLKQTHLHISARPSDSSGLLHVVLAVPVDAGVSTFEAQLVCTIPVTYEKLKDISEAMTALANDHGDSYTIAL
jgi:hypothetical protein